VQWLCDAVQIGKFEFATSILRWRRREMVEGRVLVTPYILVGSAMAMRGSTDW
jgi:hypothetical protein